MPLPSLWALHLADGVLGSTWILGGFLLAGVLTLVGSLRLKEDEIPKIALLTAAFFVISLIHVRVGFTTVHLLLNGLLGVLLGWRVAVAIPIGLALQVILVGHGGFTTLGVNACVMIIPALLVGLLFRRIPRGSWLRTSWGRGGLTVLSGALWIPSVIFVVTLLVTNPWRSQSTLNLQPAIRVTFHPVTLTIICTFLAMLVWCERRWKRAPEQMLGLLLGELAVLLSALLNALVLLWGGVAQWDVLALFVLLAHLPLAVLEGLILGFVVGFLAKVKPEMMGAEETNVATDVVVDNDLANAVACDALPPRPSTAGSISGALGTTTPD